MDLAELAQRFLRVEAFARVKGRPSKRHAMAVIVGLNGRPAPMHGEFEIRDIERAEVDAIIAQLDKSLQDVGEGRRNVILAALAEMSARYLGGTTTQLGMDSLQKEEEAQ